PVSLERFLKRQEQKLTTPLKVELEIDKEAQEVLADELSLNMIFRNLLENTVRHNKETTKVKISARRTGQGVEVLYDDFGKKFEGDFSHLGELFYKFNS